MSKSLTYGDHSPIVLECALMVNTLIVTFRTIRIMIVVTDKAGRLKRIVFATCLQVALYCFYLGNANAQTGPAMPHVLSAQRVTPFMFKCHHHSFRYCSGRNASEKAR